jgi:hypothetical protein
MHYFKRSGVLAIRTMQCIPMLFLYYTYICIDWHVVTLDCMICSTTLDSACVSPP